MARQRKIDQYIEKAPRYSKGESKYSKRSSLYKEISGTLSKGTDWYFRDLKIREDRKNRKAREKERKEDKAYRRARNDKSDARQLKQDARQEKYDKIRDEDRLENKKDKLENKKYREIIRSRATFKFNQGQVDRTENKAYRKRAEARTEKNYALKLKQIDEASKRRSEAITRREKKEAQAQVDKLKREAQQLKKERRSDIKFARYLKDNTIRDEEKAQRKLDKEAKIRDEERKAKPEYYDQAESILKEDSTVLSIKDKYEGNSNAFDAQTLTVERFKEAGVDITLPEIEKILAYRKRFKKFTYTKGEVLLKGFENVSENPQAINDKETLAKLLSSNKQVPEEFKKKFEKLYGFKIPKSISDNTLKPYYDKYYNDLVKNSYESAVMTNATDPEVGLPLNKAEEYIKANPNLDADVKKRITVDVRAKHTNAQNMKANWANNKQREEENQALKTRRKEGKTLETKADVIFGNIRNNKGDLRTNLNSIEELLDNEENIKKLGPSAIKRIRGGIKKMNNKITSSVFIDNEQIIKGIVNVTKNYRQAVVLTTNEGKELVDYLFSEASKNDNFSIENSSEVNRIFLNRTFQGKFGGKTLSYTGKGKETGYPVEEVLMTLQKLTDPESINPIPVEEAKEYLKAVLIKDHITKNNLMDKWADSHSRLITPRKKSEKLSTERANYNNKKNK